jgi:AcrR family transcriptional regulator
MAHRELTLVAQHPAVEARLGAAADAQRARVLDGVTRVVAEKGYAAATVSDIVRAAGVSRSTFYALFDGKEACFLDAFRHGVDVMIDRVRAAVRTAAADGWRAQLRAGIRAYLETLAAEPVFARTYLIEIHAAGPAALSARQDALRRFAERYHASFEQARAELPRLQEPHPDALLLLCAGTEQLVAERVRADQARRLSELEDVFCDCAESVLLRPATDPDPTTTGG